MTVVVQDSPRRASRWRLLVGWTVLAVAVAVGPTAAIGQSLDSLASQAADELDADSDVMQQARQSAEAAQAAVTAARQELDRFGADQLDSPATDSASQQVEGDSSLSFKTDSSETAAADSSPEWAQVAQQLQQLTAERETLLNSLTADHPRIVELDLQIAELSRRTAALHRAANAAPRKMPLSADRRRTEQDADSARRLAERRALELELADRYRQALERLEAANRQLRELAEAEALAKAHSAAVEPTELDPAASDVPTAREVPPDLPEYPNSNSPLRNSQPMVLGTLVAGLILAAVAAFRLARAGGDDRFDSIADVAATLAVPVVAVLPSSMADESTPRISHRASRGFKLVGQALLAIIVFAAVAYVVQTPDAFWQLCTDPRASFERVARFTRPH